MLTEYEAGFGEDGKISAVRARVYADGGRGDMCNMFSVLVAVKNMEEIYGIPNLDIKGTLVKTDKPGNTAVRGPGEPQASFIMESIIEHVADASGKDAQSVREAIIFTSAEGMREVAANPTSPDVEKHSALLAVTAAEEGG